MTFTSGRIATINGSSGELEELGYSVEENGEELDRYLTVSQDIVDLENNVIARKGIAAKQELEERDDVQLQNGNLQIGSTPEVSWTWTPYWVVPSEIVVVGNSKGEFAFELVSRAINAEVEKVTFNLGDIIEDYPGQWMGSFEDRPDNVQRGTLYGDRIEDDTDMGSAFMQSSKPQIGPWIDYQGKSLKVRIGRTGWAQVVSPGTYSQENYLKLVRNILLNYTD
jgi:hypothetical protein